jgi:hypothetical protein
MTIGDYLLGVRTSSSALSAEREGPNEEIRVVIRKTLPGRNADETSALPADN